jgi:hypothetical protein
MPELLDRNAHLGQGQAGSGADQRPDFTCSPQRRAP